MAGQRLTDEERDRRAHDRLCGTKYCGRQLRPQSIRGSARLARLFFAGPLNEGPWKKLSRASTDEEVRALSRMMRLHEEQFPVIFRFLEEDREWTAEAKNEPDGASIIGKFSYEPDGWPWIVQGSVHLIRGEFVFGRLVFKPASLAATSGGLSATDLRIPLGTIRAKVQEQILDAPDRGKVLSRFGNGGTQLSRRSRKAARSGAPRKPKVGRQPISDDELRDFAREYLEKVNKYGVRGALAAVAEARGWDYSTARKWAMRARKREILAPTKQGRPRPEPGRRYLPFNDND